MKSLVRLSIVSLFAFALFLSTARPAAAASVSLTNITCNTVTIVGSGFTPGISFEAAVFYDYVGGAFAGPIVYGTVDGAGNFSILVPFTAAQGTTLIAATSFGFSQGFTAGSCNGSFNPGDGRVDPRPGDRIAVYCQASSIRVYGVDDVGIGVYLAEIKVTDIIKAGKGGFVKNVPNVGTLYIGAGGDGSTFWAAWSGAYSANASGPFAKRFTCHFN